MKARPFDPRRLDVEALAAEGAALSGVWPGSELDRLAELQSPPQDMSYDDVAWQASGERCAVAGDAAEIWLALTACTQVWQVCQRCLQPFSRPLSVSTRLRFVRGEAQAEALDAQVDEDVLALTRALDLRVLVEDELLLALPLVPRHEACAMPIAIVAGDAPAPVLAERANPFATLQRLKSGRDKPG